MPSMQRDIVFTNPFNQGHILLPQKIQQTIVDDMDAEGSPTTRESGGVFLGFYRGPHIEITNFTRPFERDIRKARSFDRCDSRHQAYAMRKWKGSNNTVTYVGEWHTHPGASAVPSYQDMSEWRRVCRRQPGMSFFFYIQSFGDERAFIGKGTRFGKTKIAAAKQFQKSTNREFDQKIFPN